MSGAFAFGIGLGTGAEDGETLEVWYPLVLHQLPDKLSEVLAAVLATGEPHGDAAGGSDDQGIKRRLLNDVQLSRLQQVLTAVGSTDLAALISQMASVSSAGFRQQLIGCLLQDDVSITDTAEAYLKLHLLSLRHVRPNEINLENIFSIMPNVAWTSYGPMKPSEVPERQLHARLAGRHLSVYSLDKFPRMTDYVIPSGVRIADASRIRLGAYLGDGSTVMHEGLVNFNAGTLGVAMVEGRISQGVTIGNRSDLGASSSTMGTLSGGGKEKISIGERCLIGSNSGTGITLGNDCVIEAGLYITAGTKVTLVMGSDDANQAGGGANKIVKASSLAGESNLLFIRNSETGSVECHPWKSDVTLNDALHKND